MTVSEFAEFIRPIEEGFKKEERMQTIYKIFVDKFGENRVDMHKENIDTDLVINKLALLSPGCVNFDFNDFPAGTRDIISQNYNRNFISWGINELREIPNDFWESAIKRAYDSVYANNVSRKRPYIMVHFPCVTVTNEFGSSTTIKDLFMKTILSDIGNYVGLLGNRSTYTRKQLISGYIHSHLPRLAEGSPQSFSSFCTGRGPINTVKSSLLRKYDEMDWQLYCYELNRLVSVESITGTPYIRLDEMRDDSANALYMDKFSFQDTGILYKKFLKYFLDNKTVEIKFNYIDNHYDLNVDFVKFVLDVSKCYSEFIEKYENKFDILADVKFEPVLITNNKFYHKVSASRERINRFIESWNHGTLFTFKGKDVPFVVEDIEELSDNAVMAVSTKLINGIYTDLIILANNGEIIRENLASDEQETGII